MTSSSRSRSPAARITSVRSADTFALRLSGGSLIIFGNVWEIVESRSPDRLKLAGATKRERHDVITPLPK
jgi:hypothetical protein